MFVGDPHGAYQHIIDAIQSHQPIASILLGDLCYNDPIDRLFAETEDKTLLRWIHGNHDTDNPSWYANLFNSPWSNRNLHGRVELLGGLSIAGLGGVFRGKIWQSGKEPKYRTRAAWKEKYAAKQYRQMERKHESTIWPEDYESLSHHSADILVLHEAPSCHFHGAKEFDLLAGSLGVRLIVHGHHHSQYSAILDSGIAVVGLGLAQLAMFDMEAFKAAKNANEIIAAFEFGKIRDRGGDSSNS